MSYVYYLMNCAVCSTVYYKITGVTVFCWYRRVSLAYQNKLTQCCVEKHFQKHGQNNNIALIVYKIFPYEITK